MNPITLTTCVATAAFLATASGAWAFDATGVQAEALKGRPYSPYADRSFPTEVYFGDTHVHTALSADAGGGWDQAATARCLPLRPR